MIEDPLGAFKNRALQAWIATFPRPDRLAAYIATLPIAYQTTVRRSAQAIFAATEAALDAAVYGEPAAIGRLDIDLFHAELQPQLAAQFPWMNEETFARLKAFTSWYSWREGY